MSDRMFACVERYAAFGQHRTGGPADRPTAEWIADTFTSLGLQVLLDDVGFDHYRVDSTLSIDGEHVDHLVVPYEWTGSLDTTDLALHRFDPHFGGRPNPLDDVIAELGSPGQPLILATGHADSELRAVNRRIHAGSCVPTILVAGRDHDRLAAGTPRLSIDAGRQPGHTINVFAATPAATDGDAPVVVLSTPLNGWFRCAGERGTGIAVLIELIERFAHLPLLVVATGGHELSYLGANDWADRVAANASPHTRLTTSPWQAVVHIGASIAVEDHDVAHPRPLARTRFATTSLPASAAASMTTALERANFHVVTDATSWMGEAEVFDRFGLPMLSLTGAGHYFHCPEDTPKASTSPHGLTVAADALSDALIDFLDYL